MTSLLIEKIPININYEILQEEFLNFGSCSFSETKIRTKPFDVVVTYTRKLDALKAFNALSKKEFVIANNERFILKMSCMENLYAKFKKNKIDEVGVYWGYRTKKEFRILNLNGEPYTYSALMENAGLSKEPLDDEPKVEWDGEAANPVMMPRGVVKAARKTVPMNYIEDLDREESNDDEININNQV